MLQGKISFGTSISSDYPKFQAQPGHIYRAAVLHFVNAKNELEGIMRINRAHFHQVPEGQQGLGGFLCHSTESTVAPCCKHTDIFGDPTYRIAIPIVLYPTSFQGDIIPGAEPDIQILMIYEKAWNKLSQIDKTYSLQMNDFTISGKKQGRGVAHDFMPAGPAYWQQDQAIFGKLLQKAKMLVEGPGLAAVDKMLGRKVEAIAIDNAIRASQGLPPALGMMGGMPQIPPIPMGGMMPAAFVPPQIPPIPPAQIPTSALTQASVIPQQQVPPVPQQVPQQGLTLPPTQSGPASQDQIAALGNLLAPHAPAAE